MLENALGALATEETLASLLESQKDEDTPHISGHKGFFILAIRSDSDTPTANDGDYTALKLDEKGRLKVASQPASMDQVNGDITAISQSIFINTSRVSNLVITMVAATLVGHNASFEFSNNSTNGTDGTWYAVQAIRSNANTIDLTTGVLAATPAYGWELSVNGYKYVRVRATAHTSGTATYTLAPAPYATEPIPASQVSGTQPVSGTVTVASTTANIGTNGMSAFADSSANLAANGVFTGTSRDGGATQSFAKFVAKAFANVAGSFRLEQSADNTTWRRATPDTVVAADAVVELQVTATARYHRVVFTNGAAAQTAFLINSAYLRI
jgi:hypothetical protein